MAHPLHGFHINKLSALTITLRQKEINFPFTLPN
jgi:hypothetical protein